MSEETIGQPQKPRRKLTKAGKITMVVMVVVFLGIFGVLANGNTAPAPQSTQVKSSSSDLKVGRPISVNTPDNKPAPHTPTTVFDLAARGTNQSQKFTVSGGWDLKWSYDCTDEGTGNFIVYIYNSDGTMSTETPINQLGASDSGTNHYYDSGTYYFSVISGGCSWHLTVIN